MENFALPVSQAALHNQLELARGILAKWVQTADEGLPGVHVPGSPIDTERTLRELIGELQLVAGQCQTLAEVLQTAIV